ncbi:MAG: DUF5686 family protein [Lishizhenia sp.]
MLKHYCITILLLLTFYTTAQTVEVEGVVLDAQTSEPLPFVKVFFQGTKTGTETDFEGNFSIKSYYVSDSLVFRAADYNDTLVFVDVHQTKKKQVFQIYLKLETSIQAMEMVVVEAPDETPSQRLHKRIVKNKPINNKEKLEAYEFEVYNKLQLDLNNIGDKFEDRKVIQKLSALDAYINNDTTGKILPLILSESLSDFYYRTNPKKRKEVVKASRVTGVDNLELSQFTGDMYQDINVYDNTISMFGRTFVSPISPFAFSFYKFYLEDSSFIDNQWCYKLRFAPKRKGDLVFLGEMWIHDTTYAVKKWSASVPEKANINFINDFLLEQEFALVEKEVWMLTKDKLVADLNVTKGTKTFGFYARKYATRTKFIINSPHPEDFYQTADNVQVLEDAEKRTADYWKENRHTQLSNTEEGIGEMIDSLNNVGFFKLAKNVVYMFSTGYYPVGKIEIGNYQTLVSYNGVEGIRNQIELRTSNKFSRRIEFSTKLAYGYRDQNFKYGGKIRYNITPKKRGMLALYYQKDIEQLGQAPTAAEVGATFGTLLRTGPLDKLTFVEKLGVNLEKDIGKDLIITSGFEWKEFTPLGLAIYQRENSEGEIVNIEDIRTSELLVKLRYGKNEEFLSGAFDRKSLGSKWPIFSLQAIFGLKGVLGSNYDYQKFEAQVTHNPKIGIFGRLMYNLYGGYIFGSAAYPFLKVHEGSQSLWLQTAAYNKMRFFEFVSDQYVGAHIEHHWNGLLLDRIPLINTFKLRLVTNFRTVYGTISDRHKEEMLLPQAIKTFGNIPYMETGIGVENIFRVGRIDAIWRLTHLEPGESPFTIRAKFVVTF